MVRASTYKFWRGTVQCITNGKLKENSKHSPILMSWVLCPLCVWDFCFFVQKAEGSRGKCPSRGQSRHCFLFPSCKSKVLNTWYLLTISFLVQIFFGVLITDANISIRFIPKLMYCFFSETVYSPSEIKPISLSIYFFFNGIIICSWFIPVMSLK